MMIELIGESQIGITFSYDPDAIGKMKDIEGRKWNVDKKRWEVHISKLKEVIQILRIDFNTLPDDVKKLYTESWNMPFKIILGNVSSTLKGNSIPVTTIDKATSYDLPGVEYSSLYNDGKWDGRKHLLNKRKLTVPTGLIPRIIRDLEFNGIEYDLIDGREYENTSLDLAIPQLTPRDYQEAVIQKALQYKRGILEMATGAGKTLVATTIISRLKLPTLFFVHTRELMYQAKGYFEKHLGVQIGQIGDGKIEIRPITVATVQTIIKTMEPNTKIKDDTDISQARQQIVDKVESTPIIFFDECHHLPSDTCYTIAMRTNGAYYRFGLSATPYRSDGQDMLIEAATGPKLIRINASSLIDRNYLVPPIIKIVDIKSMRHTGRLYPKIYQEFIVNNDGRNRIIRDEAIKLVEDGRTVLILVQQIKHGEQIQEIIPEAGFMQGKDSTKKRQEVLRKFKAKELNILIATTLADEGLDIPSLGCVILAGGGISETRALQRVGRALRPIEEKTEAIIVDFMDHAPFLYEHSLKRLNIFKTEPRFKIERIG